MIKISVKVNKFTLTLIQTKKIKKGVDYMSKINTISVNKVNKRGVYYISFNNEMKSRPCLIISEAEHYGENILAMTITSRCNIAKLLPVVLNETVSFIRTTGLIELRPENIALRTYLGDVSEEVYNLAIDMFISRFDKVDDEKVKMEYEKYISYFENSRFVLKSNPNQVFKPSMLHSNELEGNHMKVNITTKTNPYMVINEHPEIRKRAPRPPKKLNLDIRLKENNSKTRKSAKKVDVYSSKKITTKVPKERIKSSAIMELSTKPQPYKLSEWSVRDLIEFRKDSFKMNNNELTKKYNCDERRLNYIRKNVKNEIELRKKNVAI